MKIFLMFVGMIGCTVAANLLLKTGAVAGGPGQGGITHLFNWRVLFGLVTFGLAACFYIVILQWLPLNVAQSFTAAQFVAVILASAWVLSEPIGPGQWAGIAIVGWSR